jgi:uncharacterized membrane-anchored protein
MLIGVSLYHGNNDESSGPIHRARTRVVAGFAYYMSRRHITDQGDKMGIRSEDSPIFRAKSVQGEVVIAVCTQSLAFWARGKTS